MGFSSPKMSRYNFKEKPNWIANHKSKTKFKKGDFSPEKVILVNFLNTITLEP